MLRRTIDLTNKESKVVINTRYVFLSGLIALVVLISAFLTIAPNALAFDKSDCPSGKVCFWSGPTYGGQQSFWNAWETGYHALANIDPQSMWNNTGNRTVWLENGLGSPYPIGPGGTNQWGSPYTGGMEIQ